MSVIIDGTTGITTPGLTNTGTETILNLTTTGNTILGDATTDTLNVGAGGLVKDASGNVGIGTASPDTLLTLFPPSNTANSVHFGTNDYGTVYGTKVYVQSKNPAGTTSSFFNTTKITSSVNGRTDVPIWLSSVGASGVDDYQTWSTAGSERMRLDGSGNLGLGVTPSAWRTGVGLTAVQISGGSLWSYASSEVNLAQNYYYGAGGTRYYYATAAASGYYQGGGIHVWQTAPSGTSGTAVTLTDRMTLDNSGNLGIGTSSPQSVLNAYGASGLILNLANAGWKTSAIKPIDEGASYKGALAFYTHPSSGTPTDPTERMRIDSSGNLLLGETSDAYTTANRVVFGLNGTTSALQSFRSGGTSRGYIYADSTNFNFSATGNLPLVFATGNPEVERMRIDSSGNVGINNTSPTDTAGYGGKVLDILGPVYARQYTDSTKYFSSGVSGGQAYLEANGTGVGMIFYTAGSERMRIDSSGNLLVGTTSAGAKTVISQTTTGTDTLKVENTTASPYGIYQHWTGATPNNTTNYFMLCDDPTNSKFIIYSNGTAQNRTGTYTTISDLKLKENIVDTSPKLDKLNQVRVVNYNLIGDDLKQIGFVAQELEEVFPSLVFETADLDENRQPTGETTKGVKLTVLIPILVKAIQEQQAIITDLKTRIEVLESK